jgi:hypothetical protein
MQQQQHPGQPIVAAAIPSKIAKIVMIESVGKTDIWERDIALIPPGQMQIRRNHWRK